MGLVNGGNIRKFRNVGLEQDMKSTISAFFSWRIVIAIIAAIPIFHLLLTWDLDGNITNINQALRLYSLPIVFLELIILFLSSKSGWNPIHHFGRLPTLAKQMILFWAIAVFYSSAFVSTSALTSTMFALRFCLHGLLLSALIFLLSSAKQFDFKFWTSALNIGLHAYLLLLVIFCVAVFDQKDFRWIERVPSATNIRQIGNVIGLLAIIPTATLLLQISRENRLVTLLSVTAAMAFIMWSGTRGAIFGFLVAMCVAGWAFRKSIPLARFGLLALAFSMALAVSLFIPIPSDAFGIIRIADTFSNTDPSSGRMDMWLSTIEAIQSAPLLGHGAGTYRDNMMLLNGYPFNHPHNFVLQFVYDWGILGGTSALFLVLWLGWSVFRSEDVSDDKRFVALSGFVAVIAIGLIEGTLFHPLPIVIGLTFVAPVFVRAELKASLPNPTTK